MVREAPQGAVAVNNWWRRKILGKPPLEDVTFESLYDYYGPGVMKELGFTGTYDMTRDTIESLRRQIKRLKADHQEWADKVQSNEARREETISNLKNSHARDHNKWQLEKDAFERYQKQIQRDATESREESEREKQRAETFLRRLNSAHVTVSQQNDEIRNLKSRSVMHMVDAAIEGWKRLAERRLVERNDIADRNNKLYTRVNELEREREEWKKGLLTGNLLIDGMPLQHIKMTELTAVRVELDLLRVKLDDERRLTDSYAATTKIVKAERDGLAKELRVLRNEKPDSNKIAALEGRVGAMGLTHGERIDWLIRAVESLRGTVVGGALPSRGIFTL